MAPHSQLAPPPRPSWRLLFSTFSAMARKEFIILTRYPVEFVASFAQIFLIVAVLTLAGLMFTPEGVGNRDASGATAGLIVYGFVIFMFVSDALWGIGFSVRREQKQGTLEQLYLTPASKLMHLAARVTLSVVWTSLLSVTASALMSALIGRLPFQNVPLGVYILLMGLAGTFGVGFAFAALSLHLKNTAETLVNALQFAFMVFCAPFFPFSALPEVLQWVARLIPLSYTVDAFRSTLMGYPAGFPELAPIEVELVIITLFGLLMPVAGLHFYRRAEKRARRRGHLAEY